jgi:hypothetical protein
MPSPALAPAPGSLRGTFAASKTSYEVSEQARQLQEEVRDPDGHHS